MSSLTISQNPFFFNQNEKTQNKEIPVEFDTNQSISLQQIEETQNEETSFELKSQEAETSKAKKLISKSFQYSQKLTTALGSTTNSKSNTQRISNPPTTNFSIKSAVALDSPVAKSFLGKFKQHLSSLKNVDPKLQEQIATAQQKVQEAQTHLNQSIEHKKNIELKLQNLKESCYEPKKVDSTALNQLIVAKQNFNSNTHNIYKNLQFDFSTYQEASPVLKGHLKNLNITGTYRFPEPWVLLDLSDIDPKKSADIENLKHNWIIINKDFQINRGDWKSDLNDGLNTLEKLAKENPTIRKNIANLPRKFQELFQKLIHQLPKEKADQINEINVDQLNQIDRTIQELLKTVKQLFEILDKHFEKENKAYDEAWKKYCEIKNADTISETNKALEQAEKSVVIAQQGLSRAKEVADEIQRGMKKSSMPKWLINALSFVFSVS